MSKHGYLFVFLTLTSIILSSTASPIIIPNKEWDAVFDPDFYYVHFRTNETGVEIEITVAWTGYVGFGISPNGTMNGSDLFICGVLPNGTSYSGDYYAIDHTVRRDTVSNWEFISATENSTHTVVKFSRLYDTGDTEHDLVIEEGNIRVIWAFGVTDDIQWHTGGLRGAVEIVIRDEDEIASSTSTTVSVPETTTAVPNREWDTIFDPDFYFAHFSANQTGFEVEITVAWTGYVGFGISPGGRMNESDIFICGVRSDGTTYNGDYYGIEHDIRRDTVANWEFISATENSTHTVVKFSRLYDTGDSEHDLIIEEGNITVIWAFGVTDDIRYHTGGRGAAEILIREE